MRKQTNKQERLLMQMKTTAHHRQTDAQPVLKQWSARQLHP